MVDVLTDVLSRARARGAAFASTTVHGSDWGLSFGEPARLAVHVMLAGAAVVVCDGLSVPVRAGDVIAVRTAGPHSVVGRPQAPAMELAQFMARGAQVRAGLRAGRGRAGHHLRVRCLPVRR